MSKTRQILILSLIVVFIWPTTLSFSQQSKIQSDIDFLNKEWDRFLNYMQDFEAFAKSHLYDPSNPLENVIPEHLSEVARSMADYLFGSYTILTIYSMVSSKTDQAAMRPLIKMYLNHHAELIDPFIGIVNNAISHTQSPGIATSATQMKEDLRKVKSRLESIDLQ